MIPTPEMIPKLDRKWSQTENDSLCGPQMIPLENKEWHGFASLFSFINFIFIIQAMNVKKRYWQRELQFKYNSHDKWFHLIFSGQFFWQIREKKVRKTATPFFGSIYNSNKLMLP